MPLRPIFRHLSPAGPRGQLAVLIFHRVLPRPDELFPGEIDAERFDRVCSWLARWFNVVQLDEAVEAMTAGRLPERAAAITFDDGYADNHDIALPILRRHGLRATFFVATGFLNGGRMWNDSVIEAVRAAKTELLDLSDTPCAELGRLPMDTVSARRLAIGRLLPAVKYLHADHRQQAVEVIVRACGSPALPADLMMTNEQVCGLHAGGMRIGSHTVNHPILSGLPEAEVASELNESRRALESLVQHPVKLFAYPNGKPGKDYDEQAVRVARQSGFSAAVSTRAGIASADDDPWQLPRFTPWDRGRLRFGLRLVRQYRARVNRP